MIFRIYNQNPYVCLEEVAGIKNETGWHFVSKQGGTVPYIFHLLVEQHFET